MEKEPALIKVVLAVIAQEAISLLAAGNTYKFILLQGTLQFQDCLVPLKYHSTRCD